MTLLHVRMRESSSGDTGAPAGRHKHVLVVTELETGQAQAMSSAEEGEEEMVVHGGGGGGAGPPVGKATTAPQKHRRSHQFCFARNRHRYNCTTRSNAMR